MIEVLRGLKFWIPYLELKVTHLVIWRLLTLDPFDFEAALPCGHVCIYRSDSTPTVALALCSTNRDCSVEPCLDPETHDEYLLTVVAMDVGIDSTQRAEAYVRVLISDVNDVAPQFLMNSYYGAVAENTVDAYAVTVQATDGDASTANNAVMYRITTAAVPYRINATTGEIFTTAPLDRERVDPPRDEYTFTVQAYNLDENTELTDTVNVTVVVLDLNDNAPRFANDQQLFLLSLLENTTVPAAVLVLQGEDADDAGSANAQVAFRLLTTEYGATWQLSTSGILTLTEALDADSGLQTYDLDVQASVASVCECIQGIDKTRWCCVLCAHETSKLL